jgi:hypothetical protein
MITDSVHSLSLSPKKQGKKLSPIFCLWQNLIEPTEASIAPTDGLWK